MSWTGYPVVEFSCGQNNGWGICIGRRFKLTCHEEFLGWKTIEEPFHELVNNRLCHEPTTGSPAVYILKGHVPSILRDVAKTSLKYPLARSLVRFRLGWSSICKRELLLLAKTINLSLRNPHSLLRHVVIDELCGINNHELAVYNIMTTNF